MDDAQRSSTRSGVLEVRYRDQHDGWEGFLVIDRLEDGCCAGGVRMTTNVDASEVARLARGMTLKSRAFGLRQGGAKVGIRYDPRSGGKQAALARFFEHIAPLCERMYGFGPDLNVSGTEVDDVARRVGLPSRLIALARSTGEPEQALERYHGALEMPVGPFRIGEARTGFGISAVLERAAKCLRYAGPLRVAIQGFGAVGAPAGWFLAERGHAIVAVADARGLYVDRDGLDIRRLLAARTERHEIDDTKVPASIYGGDPGRILAVPCDVLVLAATPDVITEQNASTVSARLVVEGGNIAVTERGAQALLERRIHVVPDFVASAGAVVSASKLIWGELPHDDPERLLSELGSSMAGVVQRAFASALENGTSIRDAFRGLDEDLGRSGREVGKA